MVELAGSFAGYRPVEHRVLHSDDPGLQNTAERPDAVTPRNAPLEGPLVLEPVSWNVVRLRPAPTDSR